MTIKDKTILSNYGHKALMAASVVRNANTTLQQAIDGMHPLELQGLTINWNMIHLGKGYYQQEDETTPHTHQILQLETVLSGEFNFNEDRGARTLKPKQSLFIIPHHKHGWHCSKPGFMMGSLINIVGPDQKQFFDTLQQSQGAIIRFESPRCTLWFRELLQLITDVSAANWKIASVTSLLQLLLIDALNTVIDQISWQPAIYSQEADPNNRTRSLCRYAMDFLEANYQNAVRLEDVALQVGISPRHLSRLFRQTYGDSFNHILKQIRLQKAYEMLRNHNDLFIKEIATLTGFERPAYFTECFRKEFGLTPGDVRK